MTSIETSTIPKRIIYFRGHSEEPGSALITRVCKNYETISALFTGESATRTLLNLYNLHTVRGILDPETRRLQLESSMSGPHHYYGFIMPTNAHTITFNPYNKQPVFHSHGEQFISLVKQHKLFIPTDSNIIKLTDYNWFSGDKLPTAIKLKYNLEHTQTKDKYILQKNLVDTKKATLLNIYDSLFDNPGILEVKEPTLAFNVITNAYDYDLSVYRVQVVKNNTPFAFNQSLVRTHKHAQHKLRVVTYNYGSQYLRNYLMSANKDCDGSGSGIFIERHEFIQSITPMSPSCGGYVIVGRENYHTHILELIAITIPYGYTLLIDVGAIHGDSCLTGMYMMAMTGNHEAMQTADTVFLKNTDTAKNTVISTDINIYKELKLSINKDILMTSNKITKDSLVLADEKLKKEIYNTVRINHPLFYYIWNPIITAGTSTIGWHKTLGRSLYDSLCAS
jgi:hypothetical protein